MTLKGANLDLTLISLHSKSTPIHAHTEEGQNNVWHNTDTDSKVMGRDSSTIMFGGLK